MLNNITFDIFTFWQLSVTEQRIVLFTFAHKQSEDAPFVGEELQDICGGEIGTWTYGCFEISLYIQYNYISNEF